MPAKKTSPAARATRPSTNVDSPSAPTRESSTPTETTANDHDEESTVTTDKPESPAEHGDDGAVTIPLIGWRLPLPSVPDSITLPIVNFEITAPERESAAYYLVLGGLVAAEVIEWPLGLLLATGHLLAKQQRYRALEGAVDALEEA
jgi:hypothetical protein